MDKGRREVKKGRKKIRKGGQLGFLKFFFFSEILGDSVDLAMIPS